MIDKCATQAWTIPPIDGNIHTTKGEHPGKTEEENTMKIYLNGKKISRKQALELAAAGCFARMVEEAREAHSEDPNEEIDYMVRGGTLTIAF